MFRHVNGLPIDARPDGPDAAFAARLQDLLAGRWGALTAAHQYLLQGWSCRLPGRWRDLLLDLGTEELAHVELVGVMIARLLDDAPLSVQEAAADGHPVPAAVWAAALPAHTVQAGGGPVLADSAGVPWSGAYVTAGGNLLADLQLDVAAEAQARVRTARLFHMTDDPGVKRLLRFLLARDAAHQRVCLAAIARLRDDGLDDVPVPEAFPDAPEQQALARTHLRFADGDGFTAPGLTPADPGPGVAAPPPAPGDPRLYTT